MMVIIEDIVDQYYFHSTEILQCFLSSFMIVAIIGFIYTFLEDISCWWKALIMSIGNRNFFKKYYQERMQEVMRQ